MRITAARHCTARAAYNLSDGREQQVRGAEAIMAEPVPGAWGREERWDGGWEGDGEMAEEMEDG